MSKKKVTAPLTYNPGKGRPKEHLAYLNYQEMQALKRLNGNNQERGPKGLPSFPPNDAIGSSSKASSKSSGTKNSAGSKGSGTSTSWGGSSTKGPGTSPNKNTGAGSKGSGTSTSWGGPSKASAAGKDVGAGRSGGGAGPRSGAAGTRSPTSGSTTGSGKGPSMSKDTGGKSPAPRSGLAGTRSPTSGSRLSSSGQKPGGIADLGGGKRAAGDTPGARIKGAIQQVKQTAKTQPRDTQGPIPSRVPASSYGWAGTGPSMPAAYQAQGVYGTKIGGKLDQSQYDTLLSSNTISNPALHDAVMSLSPAQRRGAAALASAARMQGLDVRTALEMGAIESNFGTAKDRKGSQYKGIAQIGPAEFSKYADPASKKLGRNDLFAGAQAGVAYMKDIADRFESKYGTKPTTGDIYGRYQQGPTGFERLTRNPDALAKDVVGRNFVEANLGKDAPKNADKITAGEFADYVSSMPSKSFSKLTSTQVANNLRVDPISKEIKLKDQDRIVSKRMADGTYQSQPISKIAEEALAGGMSEADVKRMVDRYTEAPSNIMRSTPPTSQSAFGKYASPGLPAGYGERYLGEKTLAVENFPDGARSSALTGEAAKKAAKEAGIPAAVYNSPGFAQDANRLGVVGAVRKNLSATDMAKLHARAYGEQYLTPAERRQAAVIGGIERGVTLAADVASPLPIGMAVRETKKRMGIETPKEFLSRPSYEQAYLRDVARAENIRMGRDPLGRTSYTTADGQIVQRTGPSFGQGGDRGGIASLTVPTETVAPTSTESTTGTQSGSQSAGGRPYIHFQWDLGLNVPAPTDPNYADYQKYLANRAASAAALESA